MVIIRSAFFKRKKKTHISPFDTDWGVLFWFKLLYSVVRNLIPSTCAASAVISEEFT